MRVATRLWSKYFCSVSSCEIDGREFAVATTKIRSACRRQSLFHEEFSSSASYRTKRRLASSVLGRALLAPAYALGDAPSALKPHADTRLYLARWRVGPPTFIVPASAAAKLPSFTRSSKGSMAIVRVLRRDTVGSFPCRWRSASCRAIWLIRLGSDRIARSNAARESIASSVSRIA